MGNITKLGLLILIVITSGVALSGCTLNNQSAAPQGAGPPYGGNRSFTGRNFTNFTGAQSQQFFQQMAQACQGMAEGDPCAMQTPRGNITGTCKTQNETLICATARGGPMRNATSSGG